MSDLTQPSEAETSEPETQTFFVAITSNDPNAKRFVVETAQNCAEQLGWSRTHSTEIVVLDGPLSALETREVDVVTQWVLALEDGSTNLEYSLMS